MRRFWVQLDRLLIAVTAIAALYFLKTAKAYASFPPAHRNELLMASAGLTLAAVLKWVLGAHLLGSDDWHVLRCGGKVSARQLPDKDQEVHCSLGCAHDRAELGTAASAIRATRPQIQAWITISQILLAMSLGAWVGPLMGLGLFGQGALVAAGLGLVLAFKSRSTGLRFAAGMCAVGAFVFLIRDAIDWDDWGELIVVALVFPFAYLNRDAEDD